MYFVTSISNVNVEITINVGKDISHRISITLYLHL
jgi:hypothetical protein